MAKLDDLDRLNNGSVDSNLVFKNAVLGRALGYIIMMYYRSKFLTDGSKRNQSISTVTRGSTVKTHDWRGPMLFMKNIGPASDMERFGDMTLSDLRDIVDWLCQYTGEGSNKSVEWKNNAVMLRDDNDLSVNPSTAPIKTHGVRLNCLGDQTISKLPQSTSVSIPPRHPIQNNNTATCAIATLIGLPLRVWRYRPNKAWAKNGPSDAYANPAVGLLSLSLDINHHDDWLKTPTAWQDTGSVLVVRADGKPLLPEHLEALCFWIENHVFHALAKIAEEDKVTENWKKKREVALREVVRKEKFEEVWVGFVNAKVHRGESIWKEVSNPYDTKLRNGT
ncbi:MAG: hypothetical protein M1812_005450 [Candelaria pacifica]|nr:MAG: hypothetical protein M1812_005450 [Candelaria pacifica]